MGGFGSRGGWGDKVAGLAVTRASPYQPTEPARPLPVPAQAGLAAAGTEGKLHTACHQCWVTWAPPALACLGWMNKNDGKKSKRAAGSDKKKGLTPGVPDWQLAIPAQGYCGLFVEFKTEAGTLSDAQLEMHPALQAQGYLVVIIRSLLEFQNLLSWYLGPARFRLQANQPQTKWIPRTNPTTTPS